MADNNKYKIVIEAQLHKDTTADLQKSLNAISKNITFTIEKFAINQGALQEQVKKAMGAIKIPTGAGGSSGGGGSTSGGSTVSSLSDSDAIDQLRSMVGYQTASVTLLKNANNEITGASARFQTLNGVTEKWNFSLDEAGQFIQTSSNYTEVLMQQEKKLNDLIDKGIAKREALSQRNQNMPQVKEAIVANENLISTSQRLQAQVQSGIKLTEQDTQVLRKSIIEDNSKTQALKAMGKETASVADQMTNAIKKTILWASAMTILYGSLRQLQAGIGYIVELDKELTNIQVVTGGMREEMRLLSLEYNKMAKELGSTTLEVTKGSLEFIRQGKTIEDTNRLLVASTMMSKLAAMDSAQATEYMTSIMNGFQLSSEDMMGVLDKLVALDNNYATSVGEISSAMQRSSVSAQQAGISLDELASYISTVSSVTRKNSESIGESFKTMFARMQDVKLGKTFDEMGEDISNVETALKKYGVTLRDQQGNFRDMDGVLDDLSKRWSSLEAIEKSEIAKAIAGKILPEHIVIYGD